jgi:hypothetical protein
MRKYGFEPGKGLLTAVVVLADLAEVLVLGVHGHLGEEGKEDVLEEVGCEVERDKVVPVLEDLEDVACEPRARR